jgi:hypothetical protein
MTIRERERRQHNHLVRERPFQVGTQRRPPDFEVKVRNEGPPAQPEPVQGTCKFGRQTRLIIRLADDLKLPLR